MDAQTKLRLERWKRAADRGSAQAAVEIVEQLLALRERRFHLDTARHYAEIAINHPEPDKADGVAIDFLYADGCGGWEHPRALGVDAKFAVRLLKKLVKRGNPAAIHSMYLAYLRGAGVRKSAEMAEYWARRALELGDCEPMNNLGVTFFYGREFPRDVARAVRCYRAAAAKRDPHAVLNLALCSRWGHGVPKDRNQCIRGLRRAAALGNSTAHVHLASAYFDGEGVRRDSRRARQHLRAARTRTAMFELSDRLLCGRGIRNDVRRGLQLARRLIRLGDMRGAEAIGDHFHRLGEKDSDSYRTAMKWYRRAIAAGRPGAMFTVAMCYLEGHAPVIRKDSRRGLKLLQRSAELEFENAMCELGCRYLDGLGVRRKRRKGLALLERAATLGHRETPRILGERYSIGLGLTRSRALARRWLLEARRNEIDVRKQLRALR